MGTELKLVDVMTGLPDDPVVPEAEKASFRCPETVAITDVDITSKQDVYTLRCRINGKKQPKRVLTADESRWVDAGVSASLSWRHASTERWWTNYHQHRYRPVFCLTESGIYGTE